MSTLEINYPHTLDQAAARTAITHLVDQLAAQMPLQTHWTENVLHFSGSGMQGHIDVRDRDVTIYATLGLLASAMKGMVEQKIAQALQRHFSPTAQSVE